MTSLVSDDEISPCSVEGKQDLYWPRARATLNSCNCFTTRRWHPIAAWHFYISSNTRKRKEASYLHCGRTDNDGANFTWRLPCSEELFQLSLLFLRGKAVLYVDTDGVFGILPLGYFYNFLLASC